MINSCEHQLFLVSLLLLNPGKPRLRQCQSFLQVLILLLFLSGLGVDVLTFLPASVRDKDDPVISQQASTQHCLFFLFLLRIRQHSAVLSGCPCAENDSVQ